MFMSKGLTCGVEKALVSGNNPIPDTHITASSEWTTAYAPIYGRIKNTASFGAWLCSSAQFSEPEPRMYIQVTPYDKSNTVPKLTLSRFNCDDDDFAAVAAVVTGNA